MSRSAFLTFYRSLARHRLFAFLNIGGLALGIAVFLVLFLFVRFETGFDRVLPGWDKVWLLEERYTMPGYPTDPSPYSMGGELDQLRGDFPDLRGARLNKTDATVRQGTEATREVLAMVDTSFFTLFPYPAISGDPARAIADPDAIVITEKTAKKYFGSQSAIGQTLSLAIDGKTYPYRVGAVLRDMPDNVTNDSELFVQLVRARFAGTFFDHWGSTSLYTFLQFPDAAAAAAFQSRIPGFLDRHAYSDNNIKKGEYAQSLRPLSGMHLYQPSDHVIVNTLGIVGALTLLIAILNYVNLATARAGLRAREVAMRKVLGATHTALVRQFLGEAIATVALAALIGLALAEIALPFINTIGGMKLAIHYWGSDGILLPMALLVLVVGIAAGLYPAFMLSRFRPAAVLASARAPGGGRAGARLRGGLVVVQFAIAIGFAISTAVMLAQAAHVRAADIGFKRDGLVLIRSFADSSLDAAQKTALLGAFGAMPGVTGITLGENVPGDQYTTNTSGTKIVDSGNADTSVMQVRTGPDYFTTYGARLIAGRLFDSAHVSDDIAMRPGGEDNPDGSPHGNSVILNQEAIGQLGFKSAQDAIGKMITTGQGQDARVIGVVADLRFRSPRDPVPAMAYYFTSGPIRSGFAALRYTDADPRDILGRIETVWKRIAPAVPFNARTAQDNLYERYYKEDMQRSHLFTICALLAVAIGCIGLYGLAAFDTSRRVKEIGIRKTIGASTRDILKLLIGQFMRPVLLANLIAWPLAFFAMRHWLSGFDDRIGLSPLFFVGASLAAAAIATATILGQAWRVARAEPARALRYE